MAKFVNQYKTDIKETGYRVVVLLGSFTCLKKTCQKKNAISMNKIANQDKNVLQKKQALKLATSLVSVTIVW